MGNAPGQGRKPKPTHLKLLDGEPNKDRINFSEPKPAPKAPKCPKWLSKEAKAEWRRLAPQLETLGILTELDMATFAAYCAAFGNLAFAENQIKKIRAEETAALKHAGKDLSKVPLTGGLITGSKKKGYYTTPYVWLYNKSLEQIRSFGSEFGLSPSSRTRIKVDEPDDDDDGFAQ